MKDLTHKNVRCLVQEATERALSTKESGALKRHLEKCRICSNYYDIHQLLMASCRRTLPPSYGSLRDKRGVLSVILQRVKRQRKIRTIKNTIKSAALFIFAMFAIFVIIPGILDYRATPYPQSGRAVDEVVLSAVTTATTTDQASSPDITVTPSPTPAISFGNRVPWPEVRFFSRGESDYIDADDLPGTQPVEHISLHEAIERAGFQVKIPSEIPAGYEFEFAWYEPEQRASGICYVGPANRQNYSRPRLCIEQQQEDFQGFVGHSAEIFRTSVGSTYAEYVFGGWLSTVQRAPTKQYQWENRMVPVTKLRFAQGRLYIQISSMIACDEPVCLGPNDLVVIAESLD
jgi:hypothetical protein